MLSTATPSNLFWSMIKFQADVNLGKILLTIFSSVAFIIWTNKSSKELIVIPELFKESIILNKEFINFKGLFKFNFLLIFSWALASKSIGVLSCTPSSSFNSSSGSSSSNEFKAVVAKSSTNVLIWP